MTKAKSQGENYMRKIKIIWSAPGKIAEEFNEPEKLTDGTVALFFKVPKSYSSSPARIKSNLDFISHLQEELATKTGRNIPCFLIPEDVQMVQVELTPEQVPDMVRRVFSKKSTAQVDVSKGK
jgi:hypothetical protein